MSLKINIQKESGTDAVTRSVVVGSGKALTPSGTGIIEATNLLGVIDASQVSTGTLDPARLPLGLGTDTAPANGKILIGNSSGYTAANLTAGTNISISNSAGGITINNTMPSGLIYQGSWNALTNTPTLTSSVGTQGYYYVVNVAGTTNLNGVTDWQIGDWAIFNGSVWQKIDNSDQVTSVFGRQGAVASASGDYSASQVTNVPYSGVVATDVQAAINELYDDIQATEQALTAYVTNAESFSITRGQVVYLFGAQGDRASVKLASNLTEATSSKTFGVVADALIAAGQTGYIRCQGVVTNLNLGAYTAGDAVYLGSTPGSFTATKPSAPNHLVYVGIIQRANNGNGLMYVKIQNGYELDEIHDVQITAPKLAGQTLLYDATNALWKNARLTAGTGMTVTNADASVTLTPNFAAPPIIGNTTPNVVNATTLNATSVAATYGTFTGNVTTPYVKADTGVYLTLQGGSTGASLVMGLGSTGQATFDRKLNLTASTTTASSLNIPQGVAPTTPTNGDVWTTSAGVYAQINGSTVGPLGLGSITSVTGTSGQVTVSPTTGAVVVSLPTAITNLNSLTATAATDLTLNGGSSGGSIVAGQGTNGSVTITPKGSGYTFIDVAGAANDATAQALRIRSGADATLGPLVLSVDGHPSATGANRFFAISALDNGAFRPITFQNGGGNLLIGGTTDITGSGGLKIFGTTAASSTTTGALQVAGGVGVAGAGWFGSLNVPNTGTFISKGPNGTDAGARLWCFSDGAAYLDAAATTGTSAGKLFIRTGASPTLALTIDASQNATFAKKIAFTAQTTGTTLIDLQSTDDAGIAGFGGTTKITFGSNLIITASNVGRVLAGATEIFRWGSGVVNIYPTTASTSTTTGALVVSGGMGVAGAGYFGGNLTFGTSGSVLNGTTGSIGITATGTNQNITLTPSGTGFVSVNTNTSNAGLLLVSNSNTAGYAQMVVRNSVAAGGTYGITLQAVSWSNAQEIQSSGQLTLSTNGGTAALTLDSSQKVTVNATTASTSTTTGALVVSGGMGVAGAGYFGGNIRSNSLLLAAASTPTVVAANGSIQSVLSVPFGGNVFGTQGQGLLLLDSASGSAAAAWPNNLAAISVGVLTATSTPVLSFGSSSRNFVITGFHDGSGLVKMILGDGTNTFATFGGVSGTSTSGFMTVTGTAASTSTTTGALVVSGGAGFGGKVSTIASATGTAGLNLPHGAAPTSPVNGDLWTTTGGLYARINGSTVGPYGTGGSGGVGTVTDVSVVTANGISGSVATSTSTPAITLTLGAITPSSVNSVVLSGTSTPTLAVTGTSTISGTHSGASSGTNTGDQTITLTGDVTGTGTGSFAATIGNTTVTNAKLANVATATFKGRTTAGTGSPEDLTGTQATALLDAFTTSLKGLAPASGGGTSNFLRADGSWAAPSGGSGTVTSSGTPTSGQFAKFTTATDITGVTATGTGSVVLATTPTITTPNLSGIVVSDGANVNTANAMGALAIDVTKGLNTKSVAADSTFTFSATPATANTFFSMFVTNTDTASHVLTIPSSYSIAAAATITTCTIPASGKLHLTWRYDGTTYFVYGDPVTASAGTVTSSGSPVSGNIAQFTSATNISPATVTGTGSVVLATSPTISGLTLSGTTNTSGVIDTTDTTQSTSSTTGAIITDGGIGAAKNITSGGTISGTNLGTTTAYRLIGRQVINAGTTTYTSSAGVTRILARMIAAGGGGGGVTGATSQSAAGGGGGGGSYAEKFFTVTPSTGYTCAVGAGGTAGANTGGTGGTGGSTTLTVGATTVTCNGGIGGVGMTAAVTAYTYGTGGFGGAVSVNGDLNAAGSAGGFGVRVSGTVAWGSQGAAGLYGTGSPAAFTIAGNGINANGYGAGGGGALTLTNVNRTGGVGSNGIIIIEEYGI